MPSELTTLTTHSLRIVFFSVGRHVEQRIECRSGDLFLPALASLEGNAENHWPTSPALQSVHVESRPEGKVALLVGMAGTSHWSASVLADTKHDQIVFDIACRVKTEPRWLGSSYRLLNSESRISSSDQWPVQIAPLPPLRVETNDEQISLVAPLEAGPLPRTVCWQYAISPVKSD
ncbi:MAG TPA: hypothetical protein VGJ15_08900 [Pirellulales bacterium]|jgi:hypothetical protein